MICKEVYIYVYKVKGGEGGIVGRGVISRFSG